MYLAYIHEKDSNIIGYDGEQYISCDRDRKFLHNLVKPEHLIICGHNTMNELRKAFPNNRMIVLSKTLDDVNDVNVEVVNSFDHAMSSIAWYYNAGMCEDVAVLGGAQIYKLFLPYCDCVYESFMSNIVFHESHAACLFPQIDKVSEFDAREELRKYADICKPQFGLLVYEGVSNGKIIAYPHGAGHRYGLVDISGILCTRKIYLQHKLFTGPDPDVNKETNRMVFLIYGPSCAGKTTLQERLTEFLKFPVFTGKLGIAKEITNRDPRPDELHSMNRPYDFDKSIYDKCKAIDFKSNLNERMPAKLRTIAAIYRVFDAEGNDLVFVMDTENFKCQHNIVFTGVESAAQAYTNLQKLGFKVFPIRLLVPRLERYRRAFNRISGGKTMDIEVNEVLRRQKLDDDREESIYKHNDHVSYETMIDTTDPNYVVDLIGNILNTLHISI